MIADTLQLYNFVVPSFYLLCLCLVNEVSYLSAHPIVIHSLAFIILKNVLCVL